MTVSRDWFLEPRAIRAVITVCATVIAVAAMVLRDDPAVDYSLLIPMIAAFWVTMLVPRLTRWPAYVLGIAVPIVLNIIEATDAEVSMFLLVLTIGEAAAIERNRLLVNVTSGGTVAAIIVLSFTAFNGVAGENWIAGVLLTWGAGSIVHRYSVVLAELRQARDLVADQAALQERRRIARDVHDLVGHTLSVVQLHITGARHVMRSDPDEAARALEQAEDASRASMAEIRRTVGLLRDATDAGETGTGLPSPDLSDLPELVDQFAAAGMNVRLDTFGSLPDVGSAAGLAGYRIVQEALSNVSRHTAGAEVVVAVTVTDASAAIEVRNEGGTPTDAEPGSGFGLVSMRERATSLGGSLLAGPTPSGWRVEATLPLAEPVEVA